MSPESSNHMKTQAFTGRHFPTAVTRTFSTPDPANPGRNITTRKKFDLITGLVIEKVSGHGLAERTNEPYVTLSGQYAPFGTARLTASAQNALAVKEAIRPLLDEATKSADGQTIMLKEEITVEAVVSPMRGFGFAVEELYLVNKDGSKKAIIAAPESATGSEGIDQAFL